MALVMIKRDPRDTRKLYLPAPSHWYMFNLRVFDNDDRLGDPLLGRVHGGKHVYYTASIKACWHNDQNRVIQEQLPYVTPMYVREGSIIPKIPVLDFVPDRNDPVQANIQTPITLHVYPGRTQCARFKAERPYVSLYKLQSPDRWLTMTQCYDMYLDDGVSRDSAPEDAYLAGFDEIGHTDSERRRRLRVVFGDQDARSKFTHIRITQEIVRTGKPVQGVGKFERRLKIKTSWDMYPFVERDIGKNFTVVFWHEPKTIVDQNNLVHVQDAQAVGLPYYDQTANATAVKVPLYGNGDQKSMMITVPYERHE